MNIVIIGAGKMGTQLGKALLGSGHAISQVHSKSLSSAEKLGQLLKVSYTNNPAEIIQSAELYLITTSDKAIPDVIPYLPASGIIIHTSGATSIDVFKNHKSCGVLYPVISVTEKDMDFAEVPLVLEASNANVENILSHLARSLSSKIDFLNSEQRLSLHVSAVFLNNYTQLMATSAAEVISDSAIDPALLTPLLKQTFNTIQNLDLQNLLRTQTGPAIRKDHATIEKHIKYLELHHPDLKELYFSLASHLLKQ